MARVGKTSAGIVPEEKVASLKSRGLKNPMPQHYELDMSSPDMAMDNDGSGASKGGEAPKSGKKAPGKMGKDAE